MKKALIIVTTSLFLAVSAITIINNTNRIKTIATGIVTDGDNRTLTVNTSLNISEGVGTLDVGNISLYSPSCSSLDGGVATTSKILIYCPVAEKYNDGNYRGFASSSVTSITAVFDGGASSLSTYFHWTKFKSDMINNNFTGTNYNFSIAKETEGQSFGVDSESAFLVNQNTAKVSNYSCLCIRASSGSFNLKSLTITYSC